MNGFTNEFVPEYGPSCRQDGKSIHSENSFYLFAVEGGDGSSYAKFIYELGKWKLVGFNYFTNM